MCYTGTTDALQILAMVKGSHGDKSEPAYIELLHSNFQIAGRQSGMRQNSFVTKGFDENFTSVETLAIDESGG